jgi:hypothetical protein
MHRSRSLLFIVALGSLMTCLLFGTAFAQGGNNTWNGGSSSVVSRASEPAPTTTTFSSTSVSAATLWRWNLIALASVRGWTLSFAPASGAQTTRLFAVRRRAL